MVHRRLVYIYLLNVPSFSSRYFSKIKRTSRLGRLLALSLEILFYTSGKFNNASARRALVDWYLSLFVMCKAWHQYNERLKALALLNSPLMQYYAAMYYNHSSMRKVHLVNRHVVYVY